MPSRLARTTYNQLIGFAAGLLLFGASFSPSHAVTVDFSFTNTIGNVSGIVSGQIILPSANGTNEQASAIYVDVAPSTIISAAPTTLPYNPLASPVNTPANSFDVVGGNITSATFSAFDSFSGGNLLLYLNSTGTDELVLEGGSAGYFIDQSTKVTFTPVAATPLPSTWMMMLIGLVGLGFVAYRRQKQFVAA